MKIAVTGASGLVGYPIARHLVSLGHHVIALGRARVAGLPHVPWALGERPSLADCDAVVHAAFAHVPGRYRGGEGDDPAGFLEKNLEGSIRLFEAARHDGARVIFLSSRAAYGDYPPGTRLDEGLPANPDTLYGEVKLETERALADCGVSLRITGVYGPEVPGRGHKWHELFERFKHGEVLAPRVSTEVHAEDVAKAVALLIDRPQAPPLLNVSDFLLDRRALLAIFSELSGVKGRLPEPADASRVCVMQTGRLRRLGWSPRGIAGLEKVVASFVRN